MSSMCSISNMSMSMSISIVVCVLDILCVLYDHFMTLLSHLASF